MNLPFGNLPFGLNNLVAGFMAEETPSIAKGIFVNLLKPVSVHDAVQWVNEGHSLWSDLDEEHKDQVRMFAPKCKDWSWLTSSWLTENLAQDCPGLCSLFLGWDEGRTWLDQQIIELKKAAGIT